MFKLVCFLLIFVVGLAFCTCSLTVFKVWYFPLMGLTQAAHHRGWECVGEARGILGVAVGQSGGSTGEESSAFSGQALDGIHEVINNPVEAGLDCSVHLPYSLQEWGPRDH